MNDPLFSIGTPARKQCGARHPTDAALICGLAPGHKGKHERQKPSFDQVVITTWEEPVERVLFLDFDGVILTTRTLMASPWTGWSNAAPDPILCALLRRACQQGIRIVVSSSWRDCEAQCKPKLAEGGLLEFLHDDWRTPEKGCRSREIADWLCRHPEVTDWRIADDDKFDWTPEQEAKWFVCSSDDGMPAREMRELADWAGVVRVKREDQPATPEPEKLIWLRAQLVEAEKALKAREDMERTWRSGTNAEWDAVAKSHPSTAKEPPMSKADRLRVAEAQKRIAVKCRRDVEMIKAAIGCVTREESER